jgi:aryl-alcohol dehydrogenase-like predicted oxidoreductase
MVKLGEGLWHCIHPVFLEDQLERSLDRLEFETLDVCLLHNPEYFLSYPPDPTTSPDEIRAEFYRRLEVAFTFLENEVNRGRIRAYGVSSNTVAAPPRLPHATSLTEMLAAARRAGGEHHHFRVLQMPLNLFESDGALAPSDAPDHRPVLEMAHDRQIAVLTNRPLNAFVEREMVRLADFVTVDGAIEATEELERLRGLEDRFATELAPDIQVPEGALEPERYFRWHGNLDFLVTQEIGLEQWSQMDHQVRSGVGRVTGALDRNLHGPLADRWRAWRDEYLQSLHLLLAEFRRRAISHAAQRSEAIRSAIDPVFPDARRGESLSRKALWTVASTPGVTSVLTGMRTTSYVEDAVAILDWPPLDVPEEVYGAVRAAPYLPK